MKGPLLPFRGHVGKESRSSSLPLPLPASKETAWAKSDRHYHLPGWLPQLPMSPSKSPEKATSEERVDYDCYCSLDEVEAEGNACSP